MLTTSEFATMDKLGLINPCKLRFAQSQITESFTDKKLGTVYNLADKLAAGTVTWKDVPPVEIGEFASMVWSFDTRRLVAFQMARWNLAAANAWEKCDQLVIAYKKLTPGEVIGRLANFDKGSNCMGLQCGIREGGIHSPATIFRNPEYAATNGSFMSQIEYQKNLKSQKLLGQVSTEMSEEEYQSNLKILMMITMPTGKVMSYPPKD